MIRNGLPAWYVTEAGSTATVNALMDDLRIWYALRQAGEKWGGTYGEEAEQLRNAIREQCLNEEDGYVDYTDLTTGARAGTILQELMQRSKKSCLKALTVQRRHTKRRF